MSLPLAMLCALLSGCGGGQDVVDVQSDRGEGSLILESRKVGVAQFLIESADEIDNPHLILGAAELHTSSFNGKDFVPPVVAEVDIQPSTRAASDDSLLPGGSTTPTASSDKSVQTSEEAIVGSDWKLVAKTALASEASAPTLACNALLVDDFIDNSFWAYRRLLPRDCAIVADNPVTLVWLQPPDRNTAKPWVLSVTTASGVLVATHSTPVPRLTLPSVLPIGDYRWQVSFTNFSGKTVTSAWRRFTVAGSTRAISLPTATTLLQRLSGRTGPRLLPQGQTWDKVADLAARTDHKNAFSMLARTAASMVPIEKPASPESRPRSAFATNGEYAKWMLGLMQLTGEELRRIEALAYAGRLTANRAYLLAAKARLMSLAAWDPAGESSEANQPQANRNIYGALAIGYDLLESELSTAERSKVASAINARLAAAVAATDRLDREPYSSFENSTIVHATQALFLVAGRTGFASSTALLPKMWALCIAQFQAFGDSDGSSGAGVAYAWFDLYHQTRFLATAFITAGVDLTQLSYVNRIGDYLMATTVPNRAIGSAFGDGAELVNLYSNYSPDTFRLYAALTGKSNHEWYWRQKPENVSHLGYINPQHYTVQSIRPVRPTPVDPSSTDWTFPDSGVVAFSTGADSKRSSLQFKASNFGSYNHSHADQNSFTLVHRGAELLIGSGYYPYYLSPHHANVTRATRFKNAVTFDGGIGQAEALGSPISPTAPISSMEPRAELVQSVSLGTVSFATGDATLAYRGWNAGTATWKPLLTAAYRSVSFLKSHGVILVYDWLASANNRRWEWNYHSTQPIGMIGNELVVANGNSRACISHHGVNGRLTVTSGFPIVPETAYANQFHALWKADAPTTKAGMVTVIRLDCSTVPVSVTWSGSAATVQVAGGSTSMRFDQKTATVAGKTN